MWRQGHIAVIPIPRCESPAVLCVHNLDFPCGQVHVLNLEITDFRDPKAAIEGHSHGNGDLWLVYRVEELDQLLGVEHIRKLVLVAHVTALR